MLDWGLQMQLLESMGYPTFLDHSFLEPEEVRENDL